MEMVSRRDDAARSPGEARELLADIARTDPGRLRDLRERLGDLADDAADDGGDVDGDVEV